MKKKFGDLTVREAENICNNSENCIENCAIYKAYYNNKTEFITHCPITLYKPDLDKEIELPDAL